MYTFQSYTNKFLLHIDVTAQNDIELVTLRELYYILRDDSAKSGNLKVNHEGPVKSTVSTL